MRILFSSHPVPGHVLPLLPLARAAAASGHDTAFLTSASMTPLIEPDIPVLPAGPSLDVLLAKVADRHGGAIPRTEDRPEVIAEVFVGARVDLGIAEALLAARSWAPELIVHEWSDFVGPLVARSLRRPTARLAFGPGLPLHLDPVMAAALAIRYERLGLTPVDPIAILDTSPPMLQPGWWTPANRIPLRPEPHSQRGTQWTPVDFGPRADRPLVLVSLGTIFHSPKVVNGILAGLDRLDVNVIATGGPAMLDTARGRIRVEQFVPLAQLLDGVSAVVAHGGAGTTLATLSRGIPVVFLPQGADNFRNAELVTAAGAGLTLPPEPAPDTVASAVGHVLTEPRLRSAARAAQQQIAEMHSPHEVVEQLCTTVAETPPVVRSFGPAKPRR